MFGLSVHFKIYPICYALPLYFWCSRPLEFSATKVQKVVQLLKPTWEKGLFVAGSVFAFVALTGLFYGIYGMEFLRETYLYHLTRRDVQHNFSPYFYILRMTKGSPHEQLINLLPFIPQLVLWTAFSWAFYTDLPFVCFLNTAVFVILNKVCTVQVCITVLVNIKNAVWLPKSFYTQNVYPRNRFGNRLEGSRRIFVRKIAIATNTYLTGTSQENQAGDFFFDLVTKSRDSQTRIGIEGHFLGVSVGSLLKFV